MSDPIEQAVRQGEERAEREWAIEHDDPFPEQLWRPPCRRGDHEGWVDIRTFGDPEPVRYPERCPGCNQTWEAIER